MSTEHIKTNVLNFAKARRNLLTMIIFTIVNLVLIALDFNIAFMFSAFVPQLIYLLLYAFYVSGGILIAVVATLFYFACYSLSKERRVFMLVAFILFLIDAIIMVIAVMLLGIASSFIPNFIFHAWILYYLFIGTKSWYLLRNVSTDDILLAHKETTEDAKSNELKEAFGDIGVTTGDSIINEEVQDNGAFDLSNNLETAPINYKFTDDVKHAVSDYWWEKNKHPDVHLYGNIPEEALQKAIASYANTITKEETVIMLFEYTIKNSVRSGFLLTTKCLYNKNYAMNKSNKTYISHIKDMEFRVAGMLAGSKLTISSTERSPIDVQIVTAKKYAEPIAQVLKKAVMLLQSQEKAIGNLDQGIDL